MNLKGRTNLFTHQDVIEDSSWKGNFEGQVVVFSENRLAYFKEPYRKPEYQLFYAYGGFGTDPQNIGRAIIGRFVADGESVRYNREDFIGILKPELIEEYEIDLEALKIATS